jgi:ribosomal 50S subunit-associated protein YjgA (DUF615 family)
MVNKKIDMEREYLVNDFLAKIPLEEDAETIFDEPKIKINAAKTRKIYTNKPEFVDIFKDFKY